MNKILRELKELGSSQKAEQLQRYFKTGPNQYAHGDIFWGINVPIIRKKAQEHKNLPVEQISSLLEHSVHEVRLCALLIMVYQSKNSAELMYNLYLEKTKYINNWDLVDLTAPQIVGNYLINRDPSILYTLAQSKLLWERRIAIIATFAFIKQGESEHTLKLAQHLLNDNHDLIHKAVGWMLREIGKRCSQNILVKFLDDFATKMPRTMLRYAIEHLPENKRQYYMSKK